MQSLHIPMGAVQPRWHPHLRLLAGNQSRFGYNVLRNVFNDDHPCTGTRRVSAAFPPNQITSGVSDRTV